MDFQIQVTRFHYDSDFSELSTPPASDSDSDDTYVSKDLKSRIPSYCWEEPVIPPGRFAWHCHGCSYVINLLDLRDENLKGLSKEAIGVLRRKPLPYLTEPSMHAAFLLMVSNHYQEHMRRNGVTLELRGYKVRSYIGRFVSKSVQPHPQFYIEPWPKITVQRLPKANTESVKTEDVVAAIPSRAPSTRISARQSNVSSSRGARRG